MKLSLILSFWIIALLSSFEAQPQGPAVNDSVQLNEVHIVKSGKKRRIEKIALDGWPSYQGLKLYKKFVSRVDNIPDGTLAYVDFYLNCGLPNLFKRTIDIAYKDTPVGLILYEVGQDGLPGNPIIEDEVHFTVPGQHRGRFRIDVSPLHLRRKSLYIGLKLLEEPNEKSYSIYVRFNENKEAHSAYQMRGSNKWFRNSIGPDVPLQFKMTVGVQP